MTWRACVELRKAGAFFDTVRKDFYSGTRFSINKSLQLTVLATSDSFG